MENELNNKQNKLGNELKHVAVIIDGNRRYAKTRNLPGFKGHEAGSEKVEEFLRWCKEFGIKEITIYTLSIENLQREKKELEYLFKLFRKWFKKFGDSKEVHEDKVRIKFIGNLQLVSEDIRKLALEIEKETENYDNYRINFCFAYGGRQEIVNAANRLIKSGKKEISEKDIEDNLWLSSCPDLIIRTGGKMRTSNFLPWQSVYSEWIFLEKMWPEITKEDLIGCIERFKKTERNHGK